MTMEMCKSRHWDDLKNENTLVDNENTFQQTQYYDVAITL